MSLTSLIFFFKVLFLKSFIESYFWPSGGVCWSFLVGPSLHADAVNVLVRVFRYPLDSPACCVKAY